LIDLGFGLGTLAGAAAGSPLIFEKTVTATQARGFLAGTVGGGLIGGTAAWFITRESPAAKAKRAAGWLNGIPNAGVIGQSVTPTGNVPAYGVSYSGQF
jgi:hypothetical protein